MDMKGLSFDQYEEARARAVERVKARIGTKPTRDQFKRELGSIWTPLDSLAMIVFAAAFFVSSAHIVTHMGALAGSTFEQTYSAGIIFSEEMYTLFHQVGMIFLAEASMILFMVLHGITRAERTGRAVWVRWFSVPLVLAVIAAVFVFLANVQSGIGVLESVMPPVFTVGIGLRLERLIVDLIERRRQIDHKYVEAIELYEAASADPETHPEFARVLKQTIWEKLVSLPSNKPYKDAPAPFKAAAVRRELERDTWTDHAGDQMFDWAPEPDAERPTSAPRGRRQTKNGMNSVPEPDAEEDTTPIEPLHQPNEYAHTAPENGRQV